MSYIKPPGTNESMISVLPLPLPVNSTDLNPRIRHLAVVSVLKMSISPYATDRRASSITMRIGFRHTLPNLEPARPLHKLFRQYRRRKCGLTGVAEPVSAAPFKLVLVHARKAGSVQEPRVGFAIRAH